jgi:hypothetical protein
VAPRLQDDRSIVGRRCNTNFLPPRVRGGDGERINLGSPVNPGANDAEIVIESPAPNEEEDTTSCRFGRLLPIDEPYSTAVNQLGVLHPINESADTGAMR